MEPPEGEEPGAARRHAGRAAHGALVAVLLIAGWILLRPTTRSYFWNGDDLFELPLGAMLGRGDFAAFFDASVGAWHTGLRFVPRLLWALDHRLHGGDASGYYLTNIALHLLCAVVLYAVAFQLSRSRIAAFVGAMFFAFGGVSSQAVYFLSAREDSVVTAAFLASLLLWRRRPRLVVGLYAIICLSKLNGVVLPLALLLLDRLEGERSWRRYPGLAAVLVAVAAAWLALIGTDAASSYTERAGAGAFALGHLFDNVRDGLFFGFAHGRVDAGPVVRGLAVALGVALVVASFAGLFGAQRKLAILGLGVAALALLPPVPLLGTHSGQAWSNGRYFHLPSAGMALAVAAAVAGWRGRGKQAAAALGIALVGITLFCFLRLVSPFLGGQGQQTRELVEAASFLSHRLGPDGHLVVAWRRADVAGHRLLSSGFLHAVTPGLPETLYVLFEGSRDLHSVRAGPDPFHPITGLAQGDFELSSLRHRVDRLLVQVAGKEARQRARSRWVEGTAAPRAPGPGSPGRSWDFTRGPEGWARRGPAPDRAWLLHAVDRAPSGVRAVGLPVLTGGELDRAGNPSFPRAYLSPEIISPPVDVAACWVELGLSVRPRRPLSPAGPLLPANHGVLHWAIAPHTTRFEGSLVFPLEASPAFQRVRIDLRNSPAWVSAGGVRRLGLTPSAVAAEVDLRSVRLEDCP